MTKRVRTCPQCNEEFEPKGESRSYAQRFCSVWCANENRSEHVRAGWPTEPEMRAMVFEEKLSDAEIGRRFEHSYEWARRVRNAYGIPALPKPTHREVKHGRYVGLHGWSVKEKGESRCRACRRVPSGAGPLGRLHLHHVIPRSMCRWTKADLRNGIALCSDCHQGWHDRRVAIYRDIFTPEEWEFLATVQLTGQQIGPWLDRHYPPRDAERTVAA